jgi:arsenite methyltransferase
MLVNSLILTIFLWIIIVLVGLFLFMQLFVRLFRNLIHFPIPAFAVPLINNPLRRKLQPPDEVVDWIDIHEGMTILEIGPGPGTFTLEASSRIGNEGRMFAIDIQPIVASRLKDKLDSLGVKNITVKVASVYELPFPDRTFDRVFMVGVSGEIPDKNRALLEIKRVLKDSGRLAIGEILIDPDYPTKRTVIKWCKEAGFDVTGNHGGIFHYVLNFMKANI